MQAEQYGTKRCSSCDAHKPLEQFPKDATRLDGRMCRCRQCDNARSKQYYVRAGRDKKRSSRKPKARVTFDCADCGVTCPKSGRQSRCPACNAEHRRKADRERVKPYGEHKYHRVCSSCGIDYRTPVFKSRACSDPVCQWIAQGRKTVEPIRFKLAVIQIGRCGTCCAQYTKPSGWGDYCSCKCQGRRSFPQAVLNETRTCKCGCGRTWRAGDYDLNRYFATPRCAKRVHARATKAKRRARKKNAGRVETIRLEVLAERDGWKCHICKRKVTRKTWSHDHLVPLSAGGTHTYDNVALAHHRCNTLRGAHGAAQLLLMG